MDEVQKLTVEKFADGGIACLKFSGTIDESFHGKKLGTTAKCDTLVLDLGGVKKISSFGIREWVDFVGAAQGQARQMVLVECAPKVIDQLNMVANFTGGGRLYSFYAPFRCDHCDSEHRVLLDVAKDLETIKSMKLAERPCPSCKASMYFDEDGATYFSYVIGQERFELEPAVAAFLASKFDYPVGDLGRKLKLDKAVDGRLTYVRIAGDLDAHFPRDKLADGLEGAVVLDVASVGKIEPAGAAAWRGFVQVATPLAQELYLTGVAPAFLEKLCGRDDRGAKLQVLSCSLPYACKACSTTSAQLLDVAEHHAVLRFATGPELRCPTCTGAMTCVASEASMTIAAGLPKPTASDEIGKGIGRLRERALANAQPKQQPTRQVPAASPPPAVVERTNVWIPIIATLLALVVAGGGFLAYRSFNQHQAAMTPFGELVAKGATARPAWVASETASACTERPDHGLACVGGSALAANQEDADDEAQDAAADAVVIALASRIDDKAWRGAVLPIYAAARDAKLSILDRDPTSSSARREVREARRAVTRLVKATTGSAVPVAPAGRYWEAYERDGRRYLAWVQIAIPPADLARLVELYTKPTVIDGATLVAVFPAIGWRYPKLDGGAVVEAVGEGELHRVGLPTRAVLIAANHAPLASPAAIASPLVSVEVQTDTGTQAFNAPPPEVAPPEQHPGKHPDGTAPTTPVIAPGGVNVWDRYNGGRGSGRDDPSQ